MDGIQNLTIPMESLIQVISLQLANGGKAKLTVTGSSMEPMLRHHRDSVVLIPVEGRQKIGTVAFYQRENGKYILHRIIAVTEQGYLCCGDNQAQKEAVDHSQLIATVESFTRKGKTFSVDHFGYRIYTQLWVKAFFLRPGYIALRRVLGRYFRRIRRRRHTSKEQLGG